MSYIRGILALGGLLLVGCGTATPTTATNTVTVATTSIATSTLVTTKTVVTTEVEVITSTIVDTSAPSPDTPGPDGGAACATDPAYHDEAPDGLDPAVIAAWDAAKSAAAASGMTMCLNDGKRSRAQQQQEYAEYVARYGEEVARTHVLPPEKSAHVAGYAIDVQPDAAYNWLDSTNGSYSLCRTYDNEAWHFEYAATFKLGCPPRRFAPEG